jgi:hypothetical protein
MNIQTLIEKIKLFEELVVESGFIRDIKAYRTAIIQPDTQNNLVQLKEITFKLVEKLNELRELGFEQDMEVLFPKRKVFIDFDHLKNLENLLSNPEVDTQTFFTILNGEIDKLDSETAIDSEEVESLKKTFSDYVESEEKVLSSENKAIMALIFKDFQTIKNLKQFSKALDKWNTVLKIYHQLVNSESPKDIGLIEIQNGSIEVIFDIKTEVAIDLVEIMKIAFQFYLAFLTYKTVTSKAIPNLVENSRLLELEKEKEKILLEEIKQGVVAALIKQHEERKATDKNIDKTAIPKKAEQVGQAITEHIIKGNEIKLLVAPKPENEEDKEAGDVIEENVKKLEEKTREAKKLFNQLEEKDIKLLTTTYIEPEEN